MHRMKVLLLLAVLLIMIVPVYAQDDDFVSRQSLADENGTFVDVGSASIYYVTAGDPTKPPVILIHGFGGSTFTWRDTLPALADAGFYAIALDLPPFGLSDKNPELDYSRSSMAIWVAGLMDVLNIDTATIVGHSMGGGVAAQFAARYPERLDNLVFVAGGVFDAIRTVEDADDEQGDNGGSPLGLLNLINPQSPVAEQLLRTLINEDYFRDTLRSAYYDDDLVTEEAVEGYARLIRIEDAPAGFLAYIQADNSEAVDLSTVVEAVRNTPVFIIWGEEDTWVPIALGELMFERFSNAFMITYAEVGHLPMEEAPDAFNEALINFLSPLEDAG